MSAMTHDAIDTKGQLLEVVILKVVAHRLAVAAVVGLPVVAIVFAYVLENAAVYVGEFGLGFRVMAH